MGLDNVTLRAATLDDLDGIAAIYNQLWCNTLRNRGDVEAADFCARFNIAMQLQRSPIALVAEAEGRIIAACCIGIFEDGKPRKNPTWKPCYDELFAQATEMSKTADAKLEGSLFGDSREKATADRFAATGNEYAQGQLNLIIIVPEWQGKGLGRALIDLARAELAKDGCTKFFLMSDCNSDWQFYEHLNMKRILRTTAKTPATALSSTCTAATRRISPPIRTRTTTKVPVPSVVVLERYAAGC